MRRGLSTPSFPVTEMGRARQINMDVVQGLATENANRVIVAVDEPAGSGCARPERTPYGATATNAQSVQGLN